MVCKRTFWSAEKMIQSTGTWNSLAIRIQVLRCCGSKLHLSMTTLSCCRRYFLHSCSQRLREPRSSWLTLRQSCNRWCQLSALILNSRTWKLTDLYFTRLFENVLLPDPGNPTRISTRFAMLKQTFAWSKQRRHAGVSLYSLGAQYDTKNSNQLRECGKSFEKATGIILCQNPFWLPIYER